MSQKSEIRVRRESEGLSLREAARRADMSFNHLSRIERGKASMSMTSMLRLARVLGVDVKWLTERLGAIEADRRP